MRYYELVLLFHPDQSDQLEGMVSRYKDIITKSGGNIHRFEDWGRRTLAYPINKVYKANYILMNIECSVDTINELKQLFRFNDAIIRSLVLKQNRAITTQSPIKCRENTDTEQVNGGEVVQEVPVDVQVQDAQIADTKEDNV